MPLICIDLESELTSETHYFSRDFLVAATTTEYLPTDTTMMTSPEGVKAITTLVTFPTVIIWHPILLPITVFVRLGGLDK